MNWLGERRIGIAVGSQQHEVVPIVPAAVLFDLSMGSWGHWPTAEFGHAACVNAGHEVVQGSVGAGAGATVGLLKGGIGTASTAASFGKVGALVAVNAVGSAIRGSTGLPAAYEFELDGEFQLSAPTTAELASGQDRLHSKSSTLNTTIGVVATDVPLNKAQCRRVAMAAHDGLARALWPAHSMFDGDTMFALSVPTDSQVEARERAEAGRQDPRMVDAVCAAAADTVARAIVHGVLAATSVHGVPAYRDLFPSAF